MHKIDSAFLPFLYQEDIYLIPETGKAEKAVLPVQQALQTKAAAATSSAKNILILIPAILNESENIFLLKVLQAVNLTLDDIAILQFEKAYNFQDLQEQFQFSILISLGVDLSLIDKSLKSEFYKNTSRDNIKILFADPLSVIEKDQEKKKLLWKALQSLFQKA